MYIALALMFLGLLLGRLLGGFVKVELSKCILVVISLLLMVLGIELGFNEQLVSRFAHIGVSAAVLSLCAVLGCCVTAGIFYKYIKGRGGDGR